MTIERKVGMGIAGQPSGGPTDVADVFSVYPYKGTSGGNHVINNGIDLSGEGGLTWIKGRTSGYHHQLYDTERGATHSISSSSTNASVSRSSALTAFNSNGFSLGSHAHHNASGQDYISWTFRKKEKFFDVVTWTGNGVAGREIAHSLGSVPAMIITKSYSAGAAWDTYHASLGNTKYLHLNETTAVATSSTRWNNTTPTDSVFTLGVSTNSDGDTYVAYLFADNSSEDAEDQMIKCGIHSMPAGGGTVPIDLGWEPQFILMKDANHAQPWWLHDTTRGFAASTGHASGAGGSAPYLFANSNAAESASTNGGLSSTGFTISSGQNYADGNTNFIYMAIRGPMMVEPKAATDVFAVDAAGSGALPAWVSGFPVDFALYRNVSSAVGTNAGTRMLGTGELFTNNTAAIAASGAVKWDFSNGFYNSNSRSASYYSWMWKRAKGFFDVVAYTGTGSVRTVAHSLGVVPEMMWFKKRNGATGWQVYTAEGAGSRYLHLDENYTYSTHSSRFNNTAATSSVFTVGTGGPTNGSSKTYIAYIFATLAGISKCGTYTGNGSNQTINCGFSAGSRFILIKRTDADGSTSNWYVWDSVRGIVAGNDPHLHLNDTPAEVTSNDSIDPHNSGFIVNQVSATNINVSSGTYIFYAIA